MEKFPFSFVSILSLIFILSFPNFIFAEVVAPQNPPPFQNLIPRFKIPPGNLVRYRIPQWEVLYFLKYGIVPFIFFNPNFNRTNFISQVQKFKLYFDDGLTGIPEMAVKDDASYKEFLKNKNYPDYDNVPDNAFSQNKKVAEEILRAALSKAHAAATNSKLSPIDIFLQHLENSSSERAEPSNPNLTKVLKKSGKEVRQRLSPMFWNTFINRYPFWKYSKSFLRDQGYPLNLWQKNRRQQKTLRIGTRNVNFETSASGDGDDDETRSGSGGGGEPRRSGKNFQTQGWKK